MRKTIIHRQLILGRGHALFFLDLFKTRRKNYSVNKKPPVFPHKLFFSLFFNWRIITLQNFVVFYQTSTWIRHRCTYVPSLPSPAPSHPRLIQSTWVPWDIQQIPVGYFTDGNVSFHVTLSIHLTLSSPLSVSISLFSMSVSPLLPCK